MKFLCRTKIQLSPPRLVSTRAFPQSAQANVTAMAALGSFPPPSSWAPVAPKPCGAEQEGPEPNPTLGPTSQCSANHIGQRVPDTQPGPGTKPGKINIYGIATMMLMEGSGISSQLVQSAEFMNSSLFHPYYLCMATKMFATLNSKLVWAAPQNFRGRCSPWSIYWFCL